METLLVFGIFLAGLWLGNRNGYARGRVDGIRFVNRITGR